MADACQGFVKLGYIDGEQPKSKPRKPGRIKIIEKSISGAIQISGNKSSIPSFVLFLKTWEL